MSNFDLNDDDVLSIQAGLTFGAGGTFRFRQLKASIKQSLFGNSPSLHPWLEEGVDCEYLDSRSGGGWKKGKIRLRLELIPDEPEPSPDSTFLDSLRTDINPEQQ